jgi:hypothetical protein
VGNLQATRPYVPGRVLWAALTARLTRNLGMGCREEEYRSTGQNLLENLRFGYLWPSQDGQNPCYPWDDPDEFDYHFLNSYVSTALDYDKQGAQDGSLHEAEFIMPRTRQGQPVYLTSWLWARDDSLESTWQQALGQVMLGGERRYGWGRVKLVSEWIPLDNPVIPNPEGFTWNKPIPAHCRVVGDPIADWSGEVEPLVGWEAKEGGARKALTAQVTAAYAPGAKGSEDNTLQASITAEYGLWEVRFERA